MALRTLAVLLLVLACSRAAPAAAQGADPCPPARAAGDTAAAAARLAAPAADTVTRPPDVVIRASVRASDLRFESDPRASVRLTGCVARDTGRVLERRNLPARVQSGVTYRDVYIAAEWAAWLKVECLLGAAAACLPVPPRRGGAPSP